MASLLTEMPSVLDAREIWFTNLLLLGFDPAASEEKFRIHFTRDMFAFINKKGMEVVMHFLFSRLNSHLAYEEFRDCWPVYDKKQEQQFRKACSNWIARIAKEEPQSRLPRLSASLLLSPGGDKFYRFLVRFCFYVLKTVCLRDAKSEERQVFLPSFLTSPECMQPALREVALSAMKSHIVRHTEHVIDRLQLAAALHDEWKSYACKLTPDYRLCSKEERELSSRLTSLQEKWKQKAMTGTPKRQQMMSAAEEKVLSLTHEAAVSKRKSRMKKVQDMWKSVESFDEGSTHQREVVDSILQGNVNKYTINIRDIAFQIPDVILQEYEALMRQGKVGNTYEAGKLNLTSLIQVWNCALEVLKCHTLSGEIPSFEREASYVSGELQAHRSHLAAAQNLRASLQELLASQKESIRQKEARLQELREASNTQHEPDQQRVGKHRTTPLIHIPPITLPSLGFELMPPSPEKSMTTLLSDESRWKTPTTNMGLLEDNVSTPEAVRNISRSVHLASQRTAKPISKPSFIPVPKAPVAYTSTNSQITSTMGGDHLKISDDSSGRLAKATFTQNSKVTSRAVSSQRQTPVARPKDTSSKVTSRALSSQRQTPVARPKDTSSKVTSRALSSQRQTPVARPKDTSSKVTSSAMSNQARTPVTRPKDAGSKVTSRAMSSQEGTPIAEPKSAGSISVRTPLMESMPRAHDLLADQIAAAVASQSDDEVEGHTPEMLHSLVDPISAMGRDAFVSKDRIPRTPLSKPVYKMHAMKTQLSPLLQSPAVLQQPEASEHLPLSESQLQSQAAQQYHLTEQPPSMSAPMIEEQPLPVVALPRVTEEVHSLTTVTPSHPVSTLGESTTQSPLHPTPAVTSRTLSDSFEAAEEESPLHGLGSGLGSHRTGMSSPAHSSSSTPAPSEHSGSSTPAPSEHSEEESEITAGGGGTPRASSTQGITRITQHSDLLTTSSTLAVCSSPMAALTTTDLPTLSALVSTPTAVSHTGQSPRFPSPSLAPTLQSHTAPSGLTSVKKVAFEQTPGAVTAHMYTTPTQSPSLFTTAQPPTPFQHADFDLDSSLEDELLDGTESEDEQTERTGSSEESDLEAAKEVPVMQQSYGGPPSLEEPPLQQSIDLQPTEVFTADLLNLNTMPPPAKPPPLSSSLGSSMEEKLETPSETAPPIASREAGKENLLGLSPQGATLLSYLPQFDSQTDRTLHLVSEATHTTTTPHAQDQSLQNAWLTGADREAGTFEDGSLFLVSPSPIHSMSMSSQEGSLDHSSLS